MNLTPDEILYLRRFVFETLYQLNGPLNAPDCPNNYYDLVYLTIPSIEHEVMSDVSDNAYSLSPDPTLYESRYPKVLFPWKTITDLHARARQLAAEHYGNEIIQRIDEVFNFIKQRYPDWHVFYDLPLLPRNNKMVDKHPAIIYTRSGSSLILPRTYVYSTGIAIEETQTVHKLGAPQILYGFDTNWQEIIHTKLCLQHMDI